MTRKCPQAPAPGPGGFSTEHRFSPTLQDSNERTETTVSASDKKAQRGEKRRQEEEKDRRTIALYSAVGVVVIAAALILLVWNSGLLQRNLTALNLNGTKYTAADVQYYYNNFYSTYANQYLFDPTVSVKEQVYKQETGESWYDYLLDQSLEAMANNTALAARAKAEDFALTAESQSQMNSFLSQLNTAWVGQAASRDAFIKNTFGPYMTYNRLVELARLEYLASDYANSQLDTVEHANADYETYYQEHSDELDTIIYTQFAFRASVPTTDDQGNPIEMTDEEKSAQLEALKATQKAYAESVQTKLENGADPEALAEEYKEELYSSALSRRSTGSEASMSSYASWLLDSSRRPGDITLTEREIGDSTYYYVAFFHERLRDAENTHSVRHILVRAGDGVSDPTQEQYDEAESKAQDLLDQWKAGDADEDSFAALASSNSSDTGSAASGGLISRITSTSSYVEPFRDWAVDAARRPGDTELVKTEFGWHIMYYVSTDDPVWRLDAADGLREQDYEQLISQISEGHTIDLGIGINLIKA